MIKANIKDREKVVFLLAQAFRDNQSVNYIIKKDKFQTTRIYALMEYSFDVCFHYGEVYLNDDRRSCALLLFPASKRTTLHSIWLDIKLIFNVIGLGRINLALKREASIKKVQLKQDHLYLWFLGVDPAEQHRGFGTGLLKEIINYAHSKSLPVCLETSTLTNIPWYEKNGFQIYDQLDLGYLLYFLKSII